MATVLVKESEVRLRLLDAKAALKGTDFGNLESLLTTSVPTSY